MISDSPSSSGAWTETADPDAAYREQVLKLLAYLGLAPAQAIAFVEARAGRPFETCSPAQVVPVLHELQEFLHSHRSPVELKRPWHR